MNPTYSPFAIVSDDKTADGNGVVAVAVAGLGITRTDYGSTTLNSSPLAGTAREITLITTAESATRSEYQHPAYSSTTHLCQRSRSRSRSSRRMSQDTVAKRFGKMTVDTMPNSETRQTMQRLEFFLNVLNQMCIGFVTIYMSWLCLSLKLAKTALHAWLVTIGFSFLMAEAIMCHYSGNVLTFNYKRNTKTTIHWVLQVLGGGLGVAGVLIKCIQKGFSLHSIHGKLGFAAMILCLASMLTGLSALFSARVKHLLSPLLNKTFHNLIGFACFVIALVAQFYGYKTGFFTHNVSSSYQALMEYITLLSLVLTCIGPLKSLYMKSKNISAHFKS